jgi:hypothetical protein
MRLPFTFLEKSCATQVWSATKTKKSPHLLRKWRGCFGTLFLERRDIILIDPFEMSFPVPNSEKQFVWGRPEVPFPLP